MGPVDPFVPLTCTPIQAPDCKPPPPPEQCDIEWWYCPRDPDCDGYDMSVEQIVVSTDIVSRTPEFFAPGDSVNVHVNGTTTLTSVDPGATYRIYQLAGGNQATGVLADVIQINGDRFDINLPFGLVDGNFVTNLNWFEFGIDIFREPEGTKESFCAEVGNVPYREYLQSRPPNFDQLRRRWRRPLPQGDRPRRHPPGHLRAAPAARVPQGGAVVKDKALTFCPPRPPTPRRSSRC